MIFTSEAEFEEAMIRLLQLNGWEEKVLKRPTEADLVKNWAQILFENNRGVDQLNGQPLTDTEMEQILDQVRTLATPLKLNGFINGKTVAITRDNPDDQLHYGKEVSLKIYDRHEIAAGQSRYQIAQQPIFAKQDPMLHNRRGDLMLLINGMPVFHLELKRSGVPVSDAYWQIHNYVHERIYSGIFSLVQIFVACTPDETLYFANPGPGIDLNQSYFFHWADANNEPIDDWQDIVVHLLSIPMAHQMIGFYTVADNSDGVLKVMRSYQYYAAARISSRVHERKDWQDGNQLGGFIWHTTGSGKTMTSFKSAQLIAQSKDADKVVFLMDRIELGTQSLGEYRAFAEEGEEVQATETTRVLTTKLRSNNPADTLIVTSIQKMSRIKGDQDGLNSGDLEAIDQKRLVFIVDECHRSTFGEMLADIKATFRNALFFGFTGTPIQEENQKNMNTTASVFGDELHRYSIDDGIRDHNVLGFDPYRIDTFGRGLREAVALEKAGAKNIEEVWADPEKTKIFDRYMDPAQVPDATCERANGTMVKGIEAYVPSSQYNNPAHREAVCRDILRHFDSLSRHGKFHAIMATASISEAIEYYRLFKALLGAENGPDTPPGAKATGRRELRFTALFDSTIDNNEGAVFKSDGLYEILGDYNQQYDQSFTQDTYAAFKRDVAARLAHRAPYTRQGPDSDEKLDLLIVVDQMLTGFDSKWVNTLYLDKVIRYENIIQAFSRTNRIYGAGKPFGTIRYYRYPATMEQNIKKAVQLYVGDKPLALFVDKLDQNLQHLNDLYLKIKAIFEAEGIEDFSHLPLDPAACGKFANLFGRFHKTLQAARVQGFALEGGPGSNTFGSVRADGLDGADANAWDLDRPQQVSVNREANSTGEEEKVVELLFTWNEYAALLKRYQELGSSEGNGQDEVESQARFDIDPDIIMTNTDRIDANYMNSRFHKFLRELSMNGANAAETRDMRSQLNRSFASLSRPEQEVAQKIINDILNGELKIEATEAGESRRSFLDYMAEYQKSQEIRNYYKLIETFGLDEKALSELLDRCPKGKNKNSYGLFTKVIESADDEKTKAYFERFGEEEITTLQGKMQLSDLLDDYLKQGGFDLDTYQPSDLRVR